MRTKDERLVADLIRRSVEGASDLAAFRDLLLALLARPGRVLAPGGAAKWPGFVLAVCRALGGSRAAAIGAAAAVEFVAAAADVVDDLVDDEWESGPIAWRRALNASHALPWLAQGRASALAGVIGSVRATRIGEILAQGYLIAASGEDLDLLYAVLPKVSETEAHEMTRRKSGMLVAMACRVGAAAAADDPAILDLAGTFGMHLGITSQLLNDLAGVDPALAVRGSDLRLRKKTLPVAFALRCAREEGLVDLDGWARSEVTINPQQERRLAAEIRSLGAAHYTWVVAEAHRREAIAAAREMAAMAGRRLGGRQLRRMVPSVPLLVGDAAG